jgi:nicotinamide-nucleotide amidase
MTNQPPVDQLVRRLADALRARGLRLGAAESCTGGLIAAACTDLAGSSDWFERGVVSYSNQAKQDLLGVPAVLIAAHGAVSEPVARAMVEGLLKTPEVDLGVAVTGIAGPSGGSADKPVGTVWFAFGSRRVDGTLHLTAQRRRFGGDRAQVRAQAVRHALQELLERAQQAP